MTLYSALINGLTKCSQKNLMKLEFEIFFHLNSLPLVQIANRFLCVGPCSIHLTASFSQRYTDTLMESYTSDCLLRNNLPALAVFLLLLHT